MRALLRATAVRVAFQNELFAHSSSDLGFSLTFLKRPALVVLIANIRSRQPAYGTARPPGVQAEWLLTGAGEQRGRVAHHWLFGSPSRTVPPRGSCARAARGGVGHRPRLAAARGEPRRTKGAARAGSAGRVELCDAEDVEV